MRAITKLLVAVRAALATGLLLVAGGAGAAAPFTVSISNGQWSSCGTNCMLVQIGQSGTDYFQSSGVHEEQAYFYVSDPARMVSVQLRDARYDDWLQVRVGSNTVWANPAGWTALPFCCASINGGNHYSSIDLDLTQHFRAAGGVYVYTRTQTDNRGESQTYLLVRWKEYQCEDGIDNDGDGAVDYPADRHCSSPQDDDEAPPPPQCNDGVDNDGDGLVDMSDQGCAEPNDNSEDTLGVACPSGNCFCGVDNDGDGEPDGSGETPNCDVFSGRALCPANRTQCNASQDENGRIVHTCPTKPDAACVNTGSGFYCSTNGCADRLYNPPEREDPHSNFPGNNGPRASDGTCTGQVQVFAGAKSRCRRGGVQTAGQNCCTNKLGKMADTMGKPGEQSQRQYRDEATNIEFWDNQCDIQDQKTAKMADSGYCVEVGTYCAEKWPFVGCVQRARAFCCFSSKLAAMIQIQGRQQLPGVGGWGSAKAPNCRGLTLDEFQALDFSKIDLSGYFGDLKHNSFGQMQQEAQDAAQGRINGGN